jgi:hypothetical protein
MALTQSSLAMSLCAGFAARIRLLSNDSKRRTGVSGSGLLCAPSRCQLPWCSHEKAVWKERSDSHPARGRPRESQQCRGRGSSLKRRQLTRCGISFISSGLKYFHRETPGESTFWTVTAADGARQRRLRQVVARANHAATGEQGATRPSPSSDRKAARS